MYGQVRIGVLPGLILGLVMILAGALGVGWLNTTTARGVSTAEDPLAELVAAQCTPYSPQNTRGAADRIMAGWLDTDGFDPVRIGTGKIDWTLDPYQHPTWETRFRGLGWIEPLLHQADGGPAYRERAAAIIQDFLTDNPSTAQNPLPQAWDSTTIAKRAATLVCATEALGDPVWLTTAMAQHAKLLTLDWSGAWNHGIVEARTLLALGCVTRHDAWTQIASARLASSFLDTNELGPAIAADGTTNEQAVGYGTYVYRQWTHTAMELASCGAPVPAALSERLPKLLQFLADATMPDGHLVPLGDTFGDASAPEILGTPAEYAATLGQQGTAPDQTVRVYPGGYVFGRSGWGTGRPFGAESFYSLRFGPGRQVHGHNDHQAITWYAGGHPLLVDSGHNGYLPGLYRSYLQSTRGHNVLDVPGAKLDTNAVTSLLRQNITAGAQFFEVGDTAFGMKRTRGTLFLQDPDALVVQDRVSGGTSRLYQQLWHLDPGLKVTQQTPTMVRAEASDGVGVALLRIPLTGDSVGTTDVVRGERDPIQGWISRALRDRARSSVVEFSQTAMDPTFLTVIVRTQAGSDVSAVLSGGVLTIRNGATEQRVRIDSDGSMTRL